MTQMLPDAELRRELSELERRTGPFLRQFHLQGDVWTQASDARPTDFKLRWILQMVADLAPKELAQLTVLDLGCEEGIYGLEFARHGARVLAIDGRERHVERARFAARATGVEGRYEARVGDVRDLAPASEGTFDLILCLGLIYHLELPDVVQLAATLAEMCTWATVLQTMVALHPRERHEVNGHTYFGQAVVEHGRDMTEERRKAALLASLDNSASHWLTLPSYVNLLLDAGFTTVLQHMGPRSATAAVDAATMLAVRGGAHCGRPPRAKRSPRRSRLDERGAPRGGRSTLPWSAS